MKKFSWSKHLLFVGSIAFAASACQCQKQSDSQDMSPPPATEDAAPCDDEEDEDDEETCGAQNSSNAEENSSAAAVEESKAQEPIVEVKSPEPVSPAVVAPVQNVAPEVTAEKSAPEAQQIAPSSVTENRTN